MENLNYENINTVKEPYFVNINKVDYENVDIKMEPYEEIDKDITIKEEQIEGLEINMDPSHKNEDIQSMTECEEKEFSNEIVKDGDNEIVKEADNEVVKEGDNEVVKEGDNEVVKEGDNEVVKEGNNDDINAIQKKKDYEEVATNKEEEINFIDVEKMDKSGEKIALRGRIIGLYLSGKCIKDIASTTGLTRQTISKWIKRWQSEGTLEDHQRSGAPRKTNGGQDIKIINTLLENPFTNASQINRDLQLPISDVTVRKRLHELGIHNRVPFTKEKLTARHRQRRLNFATEYVDNDMDFWGRVIFTDEKTFSLTNNGRLHCWRENISSFDEININEEPKNDNVTCNMWGWVNLYTIGELTSIAEQFTSEQYLEILEEVFLPSVRGYALPFPERIIFMHDNCPVHTSRIVRRWFAERSDLEVLNFPSKSCDLNPIENIWANIVNCWTPGEERSKEALLDHAKKSWENLRQKHHIIEKCIFSIPGRLNSVIENNGGWTKY